MIRSGADGFGPRRRASPPVIGLLATVAVLSAGCGTETPRHLEEDARELRLRELGMEDFDSTGAAPLAGVSARRVIEIRPVEPRRIGGDTAREGFRSLVRRCGGCHEIPSPRMHAPWEWRGVVGRMEMRIDSAGLLPLSDDERRRIVELLREHGTH